MEIAPREEQVEEIQVLPVRRYGPRVDLGQVRNKDRLTWLWQEDGPFLLQPTPLPECGQSRVGKGPAAGGLAGVDLDVHPAVDGVATDLVQQGPLSVELSHVFRQGNRLL